jgi:hypothetical protein
VPNAVRKVCEHGTFLCNLVSVFFGNILQKGFKKSAQHNKDCVNNCVMSAQKGWVTQCLCSVRKHVISDVSNSLDRAPESNDRGLEDQECALHCGLPP